MRRKIEQVRLANLELLVVEAGSAAELARRASTNESYISQIRRKFSTPKGTPRSVGDDLAEKLEKGMGKPHGWMDEPHAPLEEDLHALSHRIHGKQGRGQIAAVICPRHPLVSWAQAAHWPDVVEQFDPDDAEDWLPCPVKCSRQTFVLRVLGDSMAPRFCDGELIFVDPEVQAQHGRFVVMRTEHTSEAILRQFSVEGGRTYLAALNPDWPERIVEMDSSMTVSGVVVFKGEAFA